MSSYPTGSGTVVPPLSRLMLLVFLVLTVEGRVCGPTGSGTVVAPPSHLVQLISLDLTVEGRVGSYGVWYCCAPSLPHDTAV